MLSRKIEKDIINWLENENKALLIDGARQVGKTYIIRKVLNEKNFSYNEFNLLETPEIVELLKTTHSVDELITNLSLFAENPFVKGKTVIFFDEIQEFKELATKIKFWVDDGSFKFIFSGSLLGVELKNIIPDLEDYGYNQPSYKLYKAKGCLTCNNTGYKGREAVFEFLTVTEEMKRLILDRATVAEVKNLAISQEMKTLKDEGLYKMMEGSTSLEEVLRVIV